jgi:hypothetical protein
MNHGKKHGKVSEVRYLPIFKGCYNSRSQRASLFIVCSVVCGSILETGIKKSAVWEFLVVGGDLGKDFYLLNYQC